jgi:hypothetical protein
MMENLSMEVVSAMSAEKPHKTYKKTILGKVAVKVFNPLTQNPEELMLKGDPSKNEKGCFVDVWSEQEDVYLKRMNSRHMREGVLIVIDREKVPVEEEINKFNVLTDEELYDLLNSPFFKLQNALNQMTSQAPVQRLITMAEQEEKSEKIMDNIRARLAELQELEYTDAD